MTTPMVNKPISNWQSKMVVQLKAIQRKTDWLQKNYETLDAGHGIMSVTPEGNFDAIIFFDKVYKPRYVNKF